MYSLPKIIFCKAIFLIMVSALLSGCFARRQLSNHLNKTKYSIAYLHDKPVIKQKQKLVIRLDSIIISSNAITKITQVIREKRKILPLLVFNSWSIRFNCLQGSSAIREDIGNFIKKQFEDETERSGAFQIGLNRNVDYVLTLNIDTLYANSHITVGGYNFFIINGFYFNPEEVNSTVGITYSFRQPNSKHIIYSNHTTVTSWTNAKKKAYYDMYHTKIGYFHYLGTVMTEVLSDNLKIGIENIIKDVNKMALASSN